MDRLRFRVGLFTALLAGCASAGPVPYDPFEPTSQQVQPPQVHGGTPLSRSQFQDLTSRPEVAASYEEPAAAGGSAAQATGQPQPAMRQPSAALGAYQGSRPPQNAAFPTNEQPGAFQADARTPLAPLEGDSPAAPPRDAARVVEKPGALAAVEAVAHDATAGADASPYGHADDYRWLRGKLEYSHVEGVWKLRYAPIDVEDDPYGGSVVLSGDARLSDYQEGDVVYVEGKPLSGPTGVFSSGFRYQPERITRLEPPGSPQ